MRYDPAIDNYDASKLALGAQLRYAIETDQLVLHYQPLEELHAGRLIGVEALVRWQHPTRGLLYPDKFLPLAEQTDLIDDLTRWVLRRALEDLRGLGPSAEDLRVSVNVSARSIGRPSLTKDVQAALIAARIPAERLTVEVTETAILADPERAAIELRRLRDAGVQISLDDFGRGQTSLSYLTTLPVHELKIDRSFVSDMVDTAAHAAIVRSVVDLGHHLGMRVVAEGVETDDVLDRVFDYGCDVAQGYLLGRPMPLDQLAAELGSQRAREPSAPGAGRPRDRPGVSVTAKA
jgi:EAL domain-containing protein (putative c-di-GMP-specific phosphodiesterase class I)